MIVDNQIVHVTSADLVIQFNSLFISPRAPWTPTTSIPISFCCKSVHNLLSNVAYRQTNNAMLPTWDVLTLGRFNLGYFVSGTFLLVMF